MTRTVGIASIALAGLVMAMGCVANRDDAPLIILFNQAPADGCTTSPSKTALARGSGFIDANAPLGYLFTPVVQNTASTRNGSVDDATRFALIEGANIRVEASGPNSDAFLGNLAASNLLEFSQRFSFTVFPDDGLASLGFEILPPQFLASLRSDLGAGEVAEFDVRIELFGRMGGGVMQSNEFIYPVSVCNGCLVNNLGPCDAGLMVTRTGGTCQPLQDGGIVDCCTAAAGGLVCPAQVVMP